MWKHRPEGWTGSSRQEPLLVGSPILKMYQGWGLMCADTEVGQVAFEKRRHSARGCSVEACYLLLHALLCFYTIPLASMASLPLLYAAYVSWPLADSPPAKGVRQEVY